MFAPAYRYSYGVIIDFGEFSKESVSEIESRWSDIAEALAACLPSIGIILEDI